MYGVALVGVVAVDKDREARQSLRLKIFVSAADCIIFVPD